MQLNWTYVIINNMLELKNRNRNSKGEKYKWNEQFIEQKIKTE